MRRERQVGLDDLPVGGEWAVGSITGVALKCLLGLSVFGGVLLVVLAVRSRPKRRH